MPEAPTGRPPLVVVADDQEWAVRSLESVLGARGYAVVKAYSGREVTELAKLVNADAMIVSGMLKDMEVEELLHGLRSDDRLGPSVPIVITIQGSESRQDRLQLLRLGAWDVCTQPVDTDVLLAKLDSFIAAKRALDHCRDGSMVDSTTGLYSLKGLARRAREIGAEAFRRKEALACIALSTETSAHEPADTLTGITPRIVSVLRRCGRVSDAIGRIGPFEFAIIAPSTESKGARTLAERLISALESDTLADRQIPMTTRVGVAAVPNFAEATLDVDDLLDRATSALRRSGAIEAPIISEYRDVPVRAP